MTPARIWSVYFILLVLSVPWYWPAASAEWRVFGVPSWAAVSLACYLAAAILTAWKIEVVWRDPAGGDSHEEG